MLYRRLVDGATVGNHADAPRLERTRNAVGCEKLRPFEIPFALGWDRLLLNVAKLDLGRSVTRSGSSIGRSGPN